jgi:hypothetical protein
MDKEQYLRKLIREEISSVYEGEAENKKAKDAAIAAKKAQIAALQKELSDLQRGGIVNEEEVLNEMPYIGGEKDTVGLFDAIKKSSERLKEKFPQATANDISKIILSKKKRSEFAPEVDKALDAQADEQADNPNYTFNLGGPQTLKAVEKALGLVEPKAPKEPKEPKASKEKPSKETTVKSDKSSKSKPKKDEDEDVEVEDTWDKSDDDGSEDEDSMDKKAASAAKKADKEMKGKTTQASKLSSAEEEKYQKLSKGIKAKIAKLEDMTDSARMKSPDVSVLKQIINKKEVKDLFKAKGVDLKTLVSGVIN